MALSRKTSWLSQPRHLSSPRPYAGRRSLALRSELASETPGRGSDDGRSGPTGGCPTPPVGSFPCTSAGSGRTAIVVRPEPSLSLLKLIL